MGVLASWFASPLIKAGAIAVVILAIFGFGEWHGRKAIQERWDAAIGKQATKTISDIIAEEVNKANKQVVYVQQEAKIVVKEKIVEKEVVAYGESANEKCVVDDDFIRTWDDLSGLLNTDADGVPTAVTTTGDPDGQAGRTITCAEVLLAYEAAIHRAVAKELGYRALTDYNRSDYELRKAHAEE